MLAKPLKIAGATALPTNSPKPRWRTDGGTASAKRTQGRYQAVGGFACPRELIQPRKSLDADADLLTLQGRQHRPARIGERGMDPPGSSKTVARYQRSVKRTRETLLPSPPSVRVICYQLEEGADGSGKESDPPIVVRDGRADRMAKGWAERQRKQSTHRGRRLLPVPVQRTLLASKAKFWFNGADTEPSARLSEEPCAGKPHAGICEGGAR